MFDPQTAEMLKRRAGLSDAELAKVGKWLPKTVALLDELSLRYRFIAEVTESSHCMSGLKVGQRLVFGYYPFALLSAESDCLPCVNALQPVIRQATALWELLFNGRDPARIYPRTAECLDTGLEHGGLGKVRFQVSLKKIE